MKIFNSLEEIKPFYNKNTNTFEFIEKGEWLDIRFNFVVSVKSNIKAMNIKAMGINAWNIKASNIIASNIIAMDIIAGDIKAVNIKAMDIKAGDIIAGNIKAGDIKAGDINFYGVCYAYKNIKCKSIKGRQKNAKYFCLDGEVKFVE